MPTNAHPMPIEIALQCPSNALNNVIPYRTYFVQGKGEGEEERGGETSERGDASESAQGEAEWGGRYLAREVPDLFPPLYSGGNK